MRERVLSTGTDPRQSFSCLILIVKEGKENSILA